MDQARFHRAHVTQDFIQNSPDHSNLKIIDQSALDSPIKDSNSSGEPLDDLTLTCPYGCCEQEPIPDFIFKRGFIEGACSDITLRAFEKEYPLHKLILDRSGYFSRLFSGPWNDPSNSVHELIFDGDENIEQEAFEMAIALLYGANNQFSQKNLKSLIAVGQYLDIPSLVCTATNQLIDTLDFSNVASIASFAIDNNYGTASERILDSVKGILCTEGWQHGVKSWDGIPCSVIASVVGLDSFFVHSEWDRAVFIIKLLERRQKRNTSTDGSGNQEYSDDLELLEKTLNQKVYYCHLSAEQLHKLENWKNPRGEPYVHPSVLKDALWLSISLHKKVAEADRKSDILGLETTSKEAPDGITSWFIPTKDKTLYGTPDSIIKQVNSQTTFTEEPSTSGKTTENAELNLHRVTEIPPFRFSVAFSGVSELEPERRVYAKTLWYAGSYWNLYIQKIKYKRGYQMGVYIHRASSAAPSKSGLQNYDVLSRSGNTGNSEFDVEVLSGNVDNLSLRDDMITGSSYGVALNEPNSPEASDDEDISNGYPEYEDANNSFLSYHDDRIRTSVYCIIYTPSRKVKSSLTCFMSTPELFNRSQSWGWKSNSMCSFAEDGTLIEGQEKILKFMVVLGNI